MASPLPSKLLQLQESMDPTRLPLPSHISTPMGNWDFFRRFDFTQKERETEAAIDFPVVDGVIVERFNYLTVPGGKVLDARLMTLISKDQDRHSALHFKLLTAGLLIRVTKQVRAPLIITHHASMNAFRNTLILVDPGAQCTIIERFTGRSAIISHVAEAFLGENSRLTYAQLQQADGAIITRKAASLDRDSRITWFELDANKGRTFSRTTSQLCAENAETNSLSLYLAEKDQLVDYGSKAEHLAERTTSNLKTRGVLSDRAHAVYEGVLHIGEQAAKSAAFQEEDCLLLSPQAEVKASPMLYIDNNDVTCSHAATAGKVDQEKLFYLMSRGLPPGDAQRLLVRGFVWPVLQAVGDAAVLREAEPIIDTYAVGAGHG